MHLKRQIVRGSMTIEIAALMPVILLAVFGIIYLCFYVHNRTWLTAAAYEAAVTGSMEGIKTYGKVYDTAEMRRKELGESGFFGAENMSGQTTVTSDQVLVTYDLDTISVYGDLNWHLRAIGKSDILKPVKRIRQIKAAVEVFETLGG